MPNREPQPSGPSVTEKDAAMTGRTPGRKLVKTDLASTTTNGLLRGSTSQECC